MANYEPPSKLAGDRVVAHRWNACHEHMQAARLHRCAQMAVRGSLAPPTCCNSRRDPRGCFLLHPCTGTKLFVSANSVWAWIDVGCIGSSHPVSVLHCLDDQRYRDGRRELAPYCPRPKRTVVGAMRRRFFILVLRILKPPTCNKALYTVLLSVLFLTAPPTQTSSSHLQVSGLA